VLLRQLGADRQRALAADRQVQVQHVGGRPGRVHADRGMLAHRVIQQLGAAEIVRHRGQARIELHRGRDDIRRAVDHVAALAPEPFGGALDKGAGPEQHGAAQAADALVQRHVDRVEAGRDLGGAAPVATGALIGGRDW